MLVFVAQKISWLIMRFLNFFFFKFKVVGKENIDQVKGGPLIIAANHKSYWDSFFLGSVLNFGSKLWPLRFIAADGFFRSLFWRPIITTLGGFPACKGQGLEICLKTPMEILKKQRVVIFYPEGRIIQEEDQIGEPKRGVGALALWSNAPVIPVAIKGSRGMRKRKNVRIIFGQPFRAGDLIAARNPAEEDFEKVSGLIMKKIKDLFFSEQ